MVHIICAVLLISEIVLISGVPDPLDELNLHIHLDDLESGAKKAPNSGVLPEDDEPSEDAAPVNHNRGLSDSSECQEINCASSFTNNRGVNQCCEIENLQINNGKKKEHYVEEESKETEEDDEEDDGKSVESNEGVKPPHKRKLDDLPEDDHDGDDAAGRKADGGAEAEEDEEEAELDISSSESSGSSEESVGAGKRPKKRGQAAALPQDRAKGDEAGDHHEGDDDDEEDEHAIQINLGYSREIDFGVPSNRDDYGYYGSSYEPYGPGPGRGSFGPGPSYSYGPPVPRRRRRRAGRPLLNPCRYNKQDWKYVDCLYRKNQRDSMK